MFNIAQKKPEPKGLGDNIQIMIFGILGTVFHHVQNIELRQHLLTALALAKKDIAAFQKGIDT